MSWPQPRRGPRVALAPASRSKTRAPELIKVRYSSLSNHLRALQMLAHDLTKFIEQDHLALDAFVKGDPEPLKNLYSRRDDVIIANPFGPPAKGWQKAAETMDRAATNFRDGEATGFQRISEYATADLGYVIEIERF